jgi:hypothetical protein
MSGGFIDEYMMMKRGLLSYVLPVTRRRVGVASINKCTARRLGSSPISQRQHTDTKDSDTDVLKAYALGPLFQVEYICQQVSAEDYTRKVPAFYNASIGCHIRHILDHYNRLTHHIVRVAADNTNDSMVQYDVRERNTDVETNKESGCRQSFTIRNQLTEFLSGNSSNSSSNKYKNTIVVEFVDESGAPFQVETNVGRELSFVGHHGIHHLSTIRLMLQSFQRYNHLDFGNLGLAPSTIQYNKTGK